MPPASYFLPDHEAGDVLQEHERDLALRAELDEVRAFLRRFGEQDAVVGDDADGIAPDPREPGDERRAVARLEFVELAAVDDARDHFAHVVGLLDVGADDAVDLVRVEARRNGLADVDRDLLRAIEIADDPARDRERVVVVEREMVGDAGHAGVDVGAAQFLRRDDLAGRRLDERRPAQKDRPLLLDDDRLVRHRRHVRAARRAGAHHDGDLRNALRPTSSPGCRRSGRSGRGRERRRSGSAGSRRRNRRGRCTAGGSRGRSPAPAGAS